MTKPAKRNNKSKGQRREQIERKRDERSQKNHLKKEREAKDFNGGCNKGEFREFENQLQRQGLKMRDVVGDGNCLFRALADQLNGNESLHGKHRTETVNYMEMHEEDFAPFIDETVSFKKYLANLSCLGTYGGNDSIVSFARNNSTDIIIHQLNNPTFIIKGSHLRTSQTVPPKVIIHLAYHDFQHYSSVRRINDPGGGPAYTYHKEEDTVASSSTNSSQEKKNQEVKKMNKEKEKDVDIKVTKPTEKHNRNMQNVENNEDNPLILEAIETIKNETGIQDSDYIRDTFVENSYDIDSTLSYFFQMMTLGDNQCQMNGVATPPIHHEENIEESKDFDEQNQNNTCESVNCNKLDENVRKKCSENITLKDIPNNESNIEKHKDTNLKCTCNMEGSKKQCSHNNEKKHSTTVTNRSIKNPSNRQRKELAKQARKKRRHDSKKNVDPDKSPSEQTNGDKSPLEQTSNGSIQSISI